MDAFQPIVARNAIETTLRLLTHPECCAEQLEQFVYFFLRCSNSRRRGAQLSFGPRYTGASILQMLYGRPPDEPAIAPAVRRLHGLGEKLRKVGLPGKYLVELVPMMEFLPSWMVP